MQRVARLLVWLFVLISGITAANAELRVVVTIKPAHSLVAAVMEGTGTPGLLLTGTGSPHAYALRPSQIQMLAAADIVFWIGPTLETFMAGPLNTLAERARKVELTRAPGIGKVRFRSEGDFSPRSTASAARFELSNYKPDKNRRTRLEDLDPHIWLDPRNAILLVKWIADTLSVADPKNEARYRANATATIARLDHLSSDISSLLKPAQGKPFVVFHDAYHYFERRFGLTAAGTIALTPEIQPGARHVAKIQEKIRNLKVICVFSEPQFRPSLVKTVIEGSSAKSAELDPLGATLAPGPDMYFKLLKALAHGFHDCLSPAR